MKKTMKRVLISVICISMLVIFGACTTSKVEIKTADDLKGKKIGVQLGTTGDIFAEDIEDAEIFRYNKAVDAAIAVKNGNIDAVIIDLEPAKAIVAANSGLKILSDPAFEAEEYAIAIKKGNPELLGLVDVVLSEIKASGQYDTLLKGFIETPEDERDDYITGPQLGDSGILRMGTNAEFPPFEYLLDDGKTVAGLDVEIAKLIAKKADKTLEVINMEFDSLLIALESGQVDIVIAGMTVNEERLQSVDFSASYFTSNQAIIVKAD